MVSCSMLSTLTARLLPCHRALQTVAKPPLPIGLPIISVEKSTTSSWVGSSEGTECTECTVAGLAEFNVRGERRDKRQRDTSFKDTEWFSNGWMSFRVCLSRH